MSTLGTSGPIRLLHRLLPAAALLVSLCPAHAGSPLIATGGLKGVVADASGHPRMGAIVLLFNRQEKLLQRAITNADGGFAFADLLPEVYSVRVNLAQFLPAIKENISVQTGKLRMLDVNLSSLFSSIQLLPMSNADARSLMSDDWKWVLRTSSATRPILRFLPGHGTDPLQESHRALFSETRGILKVTAGDAVDGNIDAGDLGTAFALATSLYGTNHLRISGNVGYAPESGVPSAGFRTSYSRDIGIGSPEVAVSMRQLSLPGRVAGTSQDSGLSVRMVALSLSDKARLGDAIDLVYGVEMDSVSFLQRFHYMSPFARASVDAFGGQLILSYTSGNARPGLGKENADTDVELASDLESLASAPRMSLRGNRDRLQNGSDYEIAYSKHRGSREYRVGVFHQQVRNTALRVSNATGEFSGDLLPDLFSSSSVFNAGNFSSDGYEASITQQIGDHCKLSALYTSSEVLAQQGSTLSTGTADDLRALLRPSRRGKVTLQASAAIPGVGTRVSGTYQFTDYSTLNPAQVYSTQPLRATPGLNLVIRQPIPASLGLPWRIEATADLRNLLAQGYLPVTGADQRQLVIVQNPRSVRGGLSFIF